MPHTEAPFSVTFKTVHGELLTARGETIDEFRANIFDALLVREELNSGTFMDAGTAEAAGEVNRQLGPVTSVGTPPESTPRPDNVRSINTAPSNHGAPPGVEYPGDCPHGPRSYQDKVVRGRPWKFWECALDWRRDDDAWNNSRCKPETARQARA